MINEIVGICVELEPSSLVEGESLFEGEIPVLETWTVDAIANASLQVKGASRRLGKDRRTIGVGGGEVFVAALSGIPGKLLKDLRRSVLYPELPLRATPEASDLANTCVIVAGSDAAGLAGLEQCATTQLPAADELSGDGAPIAEEGQRVEVIDDHHVARVVL